MMDILATGMPTSSVLPRRYSKFETLFEVFYSNQLVNFCTPQIVSGSNSSADFLEGNEFGPLGGCRTTTRGGLPNYIKSAFKQRYKKAHGMIDFLDNYNQVSSPLGKNSRKDALMLEVVVNDYDRGLLTHNHR